MQAAVEIQWLQEWQQFQRWGFGISPSELKNLFSDFRVWEECVVGEKKILRINRIQLFGWIAEALFRFGDDKLCGYRTACITSEFR